MLFQILETQENRRSRQPGTYLPTKPTAHHTCPWKFLWWDTEASGRNHLSGASTSSFYQRHPLLATTRIQPHFESALWYSKCRSISQTPLTRACSSRVITSELSCLVSIPSFFFYFCCCWQLPASLCVSRRIPPSWLQPSSCEPN